MSLIIYRYIILLSLSVITLWGESTLKIKQNTLVQSVKVSQKHTYITKNYYGYVKEARKRRENGEKTYDIDEVMKEFE